MANQPRLLRQMLRRAIENVSDLRIVAEVADLRRLWPVVEQTAPDWLIVSFDADGHVPSAVESVLARWPGLHILAMASDGSQAMIRWVARREQALGDLSLPRLIEVLRMASPGEKESEIR